MSVADFAPEDKVKFRQWLHDHLVFGEVYVTFEKKDGTVRKMRCTLKEGVIPVFESNTESTRKKNDGVMAVFDLDKSEWRSFRIDSVKEVRFELSA